eukprot:10893448-Alexandrium_andersonii.AAC.1
MCIRDSLCGRSWGARGQDSAGPRPARSCCPVLPAAIAFCSADLGRASSACRVVFGHLPGRGW